jgi:hypothetical protein
LNSAAGSSIYRNRDPANLNQENEMTEHEEQRLANQILGLAGFKPDVVTIKATTASPAPASAAPAKARPTRYETRFETLDEMEVQMLRDGARPSEIGAAKAARRAAMSL